MVKRKSTEGRSGKERGVGRIGVVKRRSRKVKDGMEYEPGDKKGYGIGVVWRRSREGRSVQESGS